jgi:GTP-binding protein
MLSAAHNQGMEDLYNVLAPLIPVMPDEDTAPEPAEDAPAEDDTAPAEPGNEAEDEIPLNEDEEPVLDIPQGPTKLAILGRPNVGKSTLVNALLGEEAMLTGPIAGLTREAIAHAFTYENQEYQLVDTPGLRRKAKVDKEGIEFLSVGQSLQAAEAADIVVLVIDASTHDIAKGNWEVFEQQDAQIASLALNRNKPIIVALNKWDRVREKDECLKDIEIQLRHRLHGIHKPLAVPLSALKERGLADLLQAIAAVQTSRVATFSTSKLNNLLSTVLAKRSPPLANGKMVSLKFIRQTGVNPPTFTFWGNRINQVTDSYKQFLRNQLAEVLGLSHIPVRLYFRANANPYRGQPTKVRTYKRDKS